MKALLLEDYKKLVYKDVTYPNTGDGDVLIEIKACAICGSDVHGYDGSSDRRRPSIVMGHEASGIVVSHGGDVTRYKIGDRVVFNSGLYCRNCYYCRRGQFNLCMNGKIFGVSCETYRLEGAMCEYISVPEYIVYMIPDSIPFEQAALIEPLSIALHAINNTSVRLNDLVVVFGAGTIGLMLLKVLKLMGCGKIIAVDIDDTKLDKAKENGADVCINSSCEDVVEKTIILSGGKGADIALEAVGINATFQNAVACLKKGGSLTLVGNISKKIDFDLQKVVINELRLYGSYACSTEYETAIDLMAAGKIGVSDCISAVAPLSEGQKWFDRLHAGEKGLMKVILTP